MPSLSQNVSAVLDLANASQVQDGNLLGKTARIVNQIARGMMREARLSGQNQYLKFLTLSSPSREQPVPTISDPNSIVTCELLVDAVYDYRVDIQLVDRVELNSMESSGRRSCARFGRPTTLRFSWSPDSFPISGLGSDTIYIGYENIPITPDTEMNAIPPLPEAFHDVLVYRGAALVMETILDKAPGKVFTDTMERFEKQWEEWINRDAEERPVTKRGFGNLDYYDDPMEFVY